MVPDLQDAADTVLTRELQLPTAPEHDAARSSGRLSVVVLADRAIASHPVPDAGEVSLGRAPENIVEIDYPGVSRHHALLHIGPAPAIEDVRSTNGTWVRGRRLPPGVLYPLAFDEIVRLGEVLVLLRRRPLSASGILTHTAFWARLRVECELADRGARGFSVLRLRCDRTISAATVEHTLATAVGNDTAIGYYTPGEYELLAHDGDGERAVAALKARDCNPRVGSARFGADGRTPDDLFAAAARGLVASEAPPGDDAAPMFQLHSQVERIAKTTLNALILGETGVGKELLAETLHNLSPRAARPFVKLNCAAFSETLLESQLFGHERGAFTGAVSAKPGLLETAEGGTLFLDEVGELPLAMQAKLLRVIEDRQVLPVGGLHPRVIDVRFVAATNRDLAAEIARCAFRQDLYYRLNGITFWIPPLRRRISEIDRLARLFIARASRDAGLAVEPELTDEALGLLLRYHWPGNIRELRNAVERAVYLTTDSAIRREHLPLEVLTRPPPAAPPPAASALSAGEPAASGDDDRSRLIDALLRCGGNQTEAARLLGISRRTLVSRLTTYGLPRPRKLRAAREIE
ncbi:MAG TPA: sigma 54-interacting transcriptional regulator [Kofleriaceae bacterium]